MYLQYQCMVATFKKTLQYHNNNHGNYTRMWKEYYILTLLIF